MYTYIYVNILEEVTYLCLIDANSNILCISHMAGSDTYLTQTQFSTVTVGVSETILDWKAQTLLILVIFSSIFQIMPHSKYLNAWFECNDIVISVYSHYPLDPNAKSFDTKGTL